MIRYLHAVEAVFVPSVVCLGFFDGVHLGHLRILEASRQAAKQLGIPLCVHTYDIPPSRLIKHGHEPLELTDLSEKAVLLEQAGAQVVAVSRFDDQLMHMPGSVFFQDVLLQRLKARHLVAGEDHRFGFHGDTDAGALSALCQKAGIGLSLVKPLATAEGLIISSTAIRQALQQGDRAAAEAMLGRPLSPAMEAILITGREHVRP